MAKFGQQVQAGQQQPQAQPTRTQRLREQQAQVEFGNLQTRAQQIQEQEFRDKVTQEQETYYEYRPKSYSEKDWNRLSQNQKDAILRPFTKGRGLDYYASKGELVRIQKSRTVEKTVPFTLDEGENTYEKAYSNLDENLKPFFVSPDTLKAERSSRIQSNISTVDQRIAMAQTRISELDAKYNQNKQELQDYWQNKSSAYRSDPRNRERYNEQQRELEQEYEQDKEEQRGILEGFNQGKTQLSSQKDVDINTIFDYANDLANYYEDRISSRQSQKNAERKAVKDLEQRQKEAQAKGFNFTGTIKESFVDPKTKVESQKGVKYFLGGAEVTPQQFSKTFDIYKKPSGDTFFVNKGTNLSKLSEKQLEAIFPQEYAQARTQEAQRLKGFESQVEGLPVASQPAPEAPKKSFFRRAFNTTGDILSGIFLKSTVGLGTRGFVSGEPTGLSGEEIAQKREEALDKATVFGFTRGELVRGQPAPEKRSLSSFFGFGIPGVIDISGTQLAGIKLSREIRESGETRIAQQKIDVATIESGTGRLQSIDTEVTKLNEGVKAGTVTPEIAQQRFAVIEQQRLSVFQDLASKGIKTNIETNPEGLQTITLSSSALETDLAPASVKLLRMASPLQKAQLISGGLATEALEFGTIGLITGGTGTTARAGLLLSKIPGIARISPTAIKLGVYSVTAGVSIYSGLKSTKRGEEAGIGKVGGFALGASIPLTQTLAFAGGAYVGNKIYQESVISKLERGGYTKTITEDKTINGREYKVPASKRVGQTEFNDQGELTKIGQSDKLRTKIPGTDIQIETDGKIKGAFVGDRGGSVGDSVSTISGKQAGAYAGQKTLSRALYFDKDGQTAIVSFTKTPKGVRVDQFLTGTKTNEFKVLAEGAEGSKTVFVDFNRYVSRVGDPIYVQGGSLTDASIKTTFNRFIGQDQLFAGFADDLAPYSLGRTQQVIAISPKVAKGATYDLGAGTVKILSETDKVQTFASIGSVRSVRTDALKDLINQITKQEGGVAFATSGLLNKRGQVAIPTFTKPETFTVPTSFKLPQSVFSQDQFLTVSPIASELKNIIRSALGTNALLGTSALIGAGQAFRTRQPQAFNNRLFELNLQNLAQFQIPSQPQAPRNQQQQRQAQQQLQQQIQEQIFEPSPSSSPTPTPTGFAIPELQLGFGATIEDLVRQKVKRKKQGKEFAYVQDFTSKIVGFEPVEVSPKQALKLAQKVQTGFEVRVPIIVKGSNNKDARRLKRLLAQ